MLSKRLLAVVVYVTTAGWAVNLAASVAPFLDYEGDPTINGAFMAIVGGAVAMHARLVTKERDEEK